MITRVCSFLFRFVLGAVILTQLPFIFLELPISKRLKLDSRTFSIPTYHRLKNKKVISIGSSGFCRGRKSCLEIPNYTFESILKLLSKIKVKNVYLEFRQDLFTDRVYNEKEINYSLYKMLSDGINFISYSYIKNFFYIVEIIANPKIDIEPIKTLDSSAHLSFGLTLYKKFKQGIKTKYSFVKGPQEIKLNKSEQEKLNNFLIKEGISL